MTRSPVNDRDLLHMRRSERDVFRLFESLQPLGDADYTFDLHLGEGMPPDPNWPPYLIAMTKALTQRRVDVVARTPDQLWILEIKPRSGASAIGQLVLYQTLYRQEYPQDLDPNIGIIALRDGFDLSPVYDQFSIRLFLV